MRTRWLPFAGALAALLWLAVVGRAQESSAPLGPSGDGAGAIGESTKRSGPVMPAASEFLERGRKLYSQLREEVIIRDFFRDRREGVFVDVGCAYPRMYSTTYFLENHLDWSGIGIDAVASYAEAWATERPRSKFLNYFVTDRSGAMERFYLADYRPISSSKKEMVEGKKYKEIRVPGATLNHILEQSGIAKVDFLSMDIEGGQLAALHGFDIAKYRPDLACIEDYVPDRNAIFAYFEQNDYELLEDYRRFDMVNWYFAPRNRPPHPPWEPPARDPSTVMGADGLPAGSYRDSCRGCRWVDDSLACECRRISGEYVAARADTACGRGFANRDGNLACEG